MIRRSIAGLILGPSLLLGSLAWSGFVALRTIFDADRSRDVAEELLDNDEVRSQLTDNLASAVENVLPAGAGLDDEQVEQVAAGVLEDPAVEEAVLGAFSAAHGAFLGEGDVPQTLDLSAASETLRAAVVEVAPALESSLPEAPPLRVTLPTDRIPDAGPIRDFLQAAVPVLAVLAIAGCVLALLTTTDRSAVLTKAGIWALSTTAFYLVLGFGVPWLLNRYAPDQAEVFGALVTALLRSTLIPSLVLALCGAGAIAVAIMWPSAERREEKAAAEALRQSPRSAPQGPAWPGPVPQPLVYPEPDWEVLRRKSSELPRRRQPSDPTTASPRLHPETPASTGALPRRGAGPEQARREVGSAPVRGAGPEQAREERPVTPASPARPRPAPRPRVAPPRTDLPPPLPTVASVSRARAGESTDGESATGPADGPAPPPDPSRGSSSRLPTKEQDERPRKWLAPSWVEGHGWVMDPSDPKPPPSNAEWVEGVGYVVPGPPPEN